MSFVVAEKTRYPFEESVVHGLHAYGDTKIELDGAVKLNWPSVTRRYVLEYGLCKIVIPCPTLCVAFAGNNLWYAHELFSWMAGNSPFEVQELIDVLRGMTRDDWAQVRAALDEFEAQADEADRAAKEAAQAAQDIMDAAEAGSAPEADSAEAEEAPGEEKSGDQEAPEE